MAGEPALLVKNCSKRFAAARAARWNVEALRLLQRFVMQPWLETSGCSHFCCDAAVADNYSPRRPSNVGKSSSGLL